MLKTSPQRFFQVDAFTSTPYRGNPAAVLLLEKDFSDDQLQRIAMEMNLSETAFLWPMGPNEYRLRWFTPTVEVDLCGHGTLAAAHVLYEEGLVPALQRVFFHTRSGVLHADKREPHLVIELPRSDVQSCKEIPASVLRAFPSAMDVCKSSNAYLIELPDEAAVRSYVLDVSALMDIESELIIITARSAQKTRDFVSRVFCPRYGIPEDPVTGAAHCVLAPFWSAKFDKTKLTGEQISPRTGVVHTTLFETTVSLAGLAVTVFKGIVLKMPVNPA